MTQAHRDIINEGDIEILVDSFYKKVLSDPIIGFIFTDIAKISLPDHLPTMYTFWSSVLFGTKNYAGNPMLKHLALAEKVKLKKAHFDRWLALWKSTVNQLYQGEVANLAIKRAESIAVLMQYKIEKMKMEG